METPKKTGLGNSLLLRRTVPPTVLPVIPADIPSPVASPSPEVLPSPQTIPEAVPVPPNQASQRSPKKPLVLRDRCTLYIAREVNEQLEIAARIERRERSEIVSDILRKQLPKYRIERQE